MDKDILICGVGGQGTVLASKILAAAAMEEGNTVHSAETIGMAQRGGPVTSHVRIGDSAFSPMIPSFCADIMLAFEPSEAVRNLRFLKRDGFAIVNTVKMSSVLAPRGTDGSARDPVGYIGERFDCLFVDADLECAEFGTSKFFNMLILGAAAGTGRLGIRRETLLELIEKLVPPKYVEINKNAFLKGFAIGGGSLNQ